MSLVFRLFSASSRLLMRGYVLLRRASPSPMLQIMRAFPLRGVTLNSYPAMLVRSCSEHWALRETRRSYEVPATSFVAIAWP